MFYCDPTFLKYYDELMGFVDPEVNHPSWLFEVCDGELPNKVADIGAGTGRVAQQILESSTSVMLCAIEPNEALYHSLLQKGISAVKQTVQEHSQIRAEYYHLAFVTYGCLQYVPDLVTLRSSLESVYKILAPGGKFAGEFFASDVYRSLKEELHTPIILDGEWWDLSMKIEDLNGGLLKVISTITNNLGKTAGEMVEIFFPVSDSQCHELLESVGFDEVRVIKNGAYYRCVGVKN